MNEMNNQYILISFLSDRFHELRSFWKRYRETDVGDAFIGTDRVMNKNLGGLLILFDWDKLQIVTKINVSTPTGFDYNDRLIYLSHGGNKIGLFDKLLSHNTDISHPYLNDTHSVNLSDRGILIASTGVDAIVELDFKGNLLFEWFAMEHGYLADPKGRVRKIDKNFDHRSSQYPTLSHTTHLNSVIYAGKTDYFNETILCVLFHQGEILAIDRKTGEHEIAIKGLNHPHSIYKLKDGYIVSDTQNNRVLLLSENFNVFKIIDIPHLDWVQDAVVLPNLNMMVADSNNFRIIEINYLDKKIVKEFKFSSELKIYQVKPIMKSWFKC